VFICGFLTISAQADPFGTNLTLQAALDYGAGNNPRLQAAFNQWKGAEENIAVQKGLPDPTLSYGYYFEPIETRTGPQNHRPEASRRHLSLYRLRPQICRSGHRAKVLRLVHQPALLQRGNHPSVCRESLSMPQTLFKRRAPYDFSFQFM